jgi:hypothetical protein
MSLGIGLVLGSLGTARAQPILERLEERIRSRVGGAEEAAEPSPPQGVEQPPAAADLPGDPARTSELRKTGYLGLVADDQGEENRGVRVLEVRPGAPAQKAGFEKQDLITSVAGIRVHNLTEMADVMELFPPGKTIGFEVIRGETQQRLNATLGRPPGPPAAPPQAVTAERPPELPQPRVDVPPEPVPPAGPLPGELRAEGGIGLPPAEQPVIEPPDAPERPPTIEELLLRIEALERRVAELEQARGNP